METEDFKALHDAMNVPINAIDGIMVKLENNGKIYSDEYKNLKIIYQSFSNMQDIYLQKSKQTLND